MITIRRLRKVVQYNPRTGTFRRKLKTGCKGRIGELMGSLKPHGYIAIQIDGYRTYAHRLAWAWMTGKWPKEIDHVNGNRSDNRWANLRKATRFQNNGNRRFNHKKKHNHLPKGVVQIDNLDKTFTYYGRISMDGRQKWSKPYIDPNAAHEAYMEMAKIQYGNFARAK